MTVVNTSFNFEELGDSKYREIDRSRETTDRYTQRRTALKTTQSRSSTRTPDYRKLVRSQKLPSNPYSFTRRIEKSPTGYTQDDTGEILQSGPYKGLYRYSRLRTGLVDLPYPHGFPNVTGPSSAELAAMDRKCIQDLLMKIKDQKINLAQAAAERAQTAQTVGDAAVKLAKALAALKKGNLAGAAGALGLVGRQVRRQDNRNYYNQQKHLAARWLELQYGWKPLISDVYGAAEALAKAYHLPPVEKVVKTRWVDTYRETPFMNSQNVYKWSDYEHSRTYIRYVCSFTNGTPMTKTLSELGITNPALIAWELMPWSFVIDWFIPIGDFISSWDATLGLQFQQGTKTVYTKGETTRTHQHGPDTGYGGIRSGLSVCSVESISVNRTKLSSFPSPQLPAFKNPLSLEHLANAMALLRQLKR